MHVGVMSMFVGSSVCRSNSERAAERQCRRKNNFIFHGRFLQVERVERGTEPLVRDFGQSKKQIRIAPAKASAIEVA
jgi:hypothetical protein